MTTLHRLIVPTVLVCAAMSVPAFEINPAEHNAENIKRSLKQEYQRYLSRLSHPTHEQLTELSIRCAEAKITLRWCDLPKADLTGAMLFEEAQVKQGVRWNDDPNNFFNVGQEATWFFWLKAAAYTPQINDRYPLEYRSHYGDLQFLHGMGHGNATPGETHDRVIEWAHFAYDVAIGRILPDSTLATLQDRYPFTRAFAKTSKRNWTVKKLFTNVNDVLWPKHQDLEADNTKIAAIALGALLHTLQDSYSESHVERARDRNDGRFPVVSWLNYKDQDAGCHGDADKKITFITDDSEYKPAISWGAWIVRNAMLKVPWKDELEEKMKSDVFELDKKARTSDAGGCPRTTPSPSSDSVTKYG